MISTQSFSKYMAYGFNYNFNYDLVKVFRFIIFYFCSVFCHFNFSALFKKFYIYFGINQGPTWQT